jgi:syntaxin 18
MPDLTADFQAIANGLPKPPESRKEFRKEPSFDPFMKEAYRIEQHIISLKEFLLITRKAYLRNEGPKRKHGNQHTKPIASQIPARAQFEGSLFSAFPKTITHLTDKERDEIDFQAKMIIRRCMDRVKDLEDAEKMRQDAVKAQSAKQLSRFFSNILASTETARSDDLLAVHRSGVVWLLNKRLMEVSQLQKSQQETRLMKAVEKSENQLHMSSLPPARFLANQSQKPTKSTMVMDQHSVNSGVESRFQQLFDERGAESKPPTQTSIDPWEADTGNAFEDQLSQDQLQMLERENDTMLSEMENTLNQVRDAEKALLEISTLQSQLTSHLAVQTAQTDQLYAEAIATTDRVEQGNQQLVRARERNRGTRKMILAFLIGASFVLLFLDWYD